MGLPLIVESCERGDNVHVDVNGIFGHPFNSIAMPAVTVLRFVSRQRSEVLT